MKKRFIFSLIVFWGLLNFDDCRANKMYYLQKMILLRGKMAVSHELTAHELTRWDDFARNAMAEMLTELSDFQAFDEWESLLREFSDASQLFRAQLWFIERDVARFDANSSTDSDGEDPEEDVYAQSTLSCDGVSQNPDSQELSA